MDKESKKLFGNKIAIGNMILKKLNKNDIIYNLVLDDDEKNKLLFSIYIHIFQIFLKNFGKALNQLQQYY